MKASLTSSIPLSASWIHSPLNETNRGLRGDSGLLFFFMYKLNRYHNWNLAAYLVILFFFLFFFFFFFLFKYEYLPRMLLFGSVQFKIISQRSRKPLGTVSSVLFLKQLTYWSDSVTTTLSRPFDVEPPTPPSLSLTLSLSPSPPPQREAADVWCVPPVSGLSFDSTLLSPLLFFCLVLLLFLSCLFLPAGPFFWTFAGKFFNIFR